MLNKEENEFYLLSLLSLLRIRYEKQIKEMSAIDREVFLFDKMLKEMPVNLEKGDLFAKTIGFPRTKPFPQQICSEMEIWKSRRTKLAEQPKTARQKWRDAPFFLHAESATGHCMMDYERIVRFGLSSYRLEAEQELASESCSDEKKEMLTAMLQTLDSVRTFAERFAAEADRKAKNESDESERARLAEIARMCRKLPEQPAV